MGVDLLGESDEARDGGGHPLAERDEPLLHHFLRVCWMLGDEVAER